MKIHYLGHSSFLLEESTGTAIVTDPYFDGVGYKMPKTFANAVTVSHSHRGHNDIKSVEGNPLVIDKEGEYELEGVRIAGYLFNHDDKDGDERGKVIVYKYRMDGLDICHLGDIGEECSVELLEEILPINILLIPVGGNSTIDAETAKKYVDKILPEIVIPMHYKTKSSSFNLDKVEEFTDLFQNYNVEFSNESSLEFSRDDMDDEETKIIVMKRIKKI